MNDGILKYDLNSKRFELIDSDGTRSALHCGDCFDVFLDGKWQPTRIELDWDSQNWYLVDTNISELDGQKARFNGNKRF